MVDPRMVVDQAALAELLAGAISGHGYRGPSTDPVVLARRLVESERVRVDVPGRLTVEQVADLALRCGAAQTNVARLEAEVTAVTADRDRLAGEVTELREQLAEYGWLTVLTAGAVVDGSTGEVVPA